MWTTADGHKPESTNEGLFLAFLSPYRRVRHTERKILRATWPDVREQDEAVEGVYSKQTMLDKGWLQKFCFWSNVFDG